MSRPASPLSSDRIFPDKIILLPKGSQIYTTTGRSERFSTKLEQIHARNFLKEAVEHALLANLMLFVKNLPNICLLKNPYQTRGGEV